MRLTQRIGYWRRTRRQVKVTLRWYDLDPTEGMPTFLQEEKLRYPLTSADHLIISDLFRPDRVPPEGVRINRGESLKFADVIGPKRVTHVGNVRIGR